MQKKLPFRDHHLMNLLHDYEQQNLPLDLFISHYFRAHKALGSKDRGCIAETIYSIIRWQSLLDYLSPSHPSWEQRVDILKNINWDTVFNEHPDLPPHTRVSFPQCLYDLIVKSHGVEKASELCVISNQPAPTTVRINSQKTTRDQMLERWKSLYPVSPCQFSEHGIIFHQKTHFFSLPEFREGLFEIQDEGSQLIGHMLQANPGQQVMDYCSGSGGKTLAFAPNMKGTGQIFLHDIRPHALIEAQKRLRRAGIQNAQTVLDGDAKLSRLKKRMDWVLVDAPCTGTGTMRRNPDMKWKFDEETLPRLVSQQRVIFEKALSYMKPDGHIVYATCSILKEENESQLDHFVKIYGLKVKGEPFHSLPSKGGMDGFFGVVLTR